MSHAYSFSLIIIFSYLTILWYERPTVTKSLAIGFIFGLITLIRPVNALVSLFFIFWDVKNILDVKNRILFIVKKSWLLILALIPFIMVWFPQFYYWKVVSGHYLYYSYGDERFFFGNSHILEGLFSVRKGWLFYTPIMFFPIIGMPLVWKYMRSFFIPIIITFAFCIYIFFSWWCWWYGGSFGMRPMVDISGLLAVPFALVISHSLKCKRFWKNSIVGFSIFLIVLNLFYYEKFLHSSIHWDSMSIKSFWGSFFSIHPKGDYYQTLQPYDYEKAKKGIYIIIKPS